MALNNQQLLEEVILQVLKGSGKGQMGGAPKRHNIRGEPHYLNYATAEEMNHLKDDGGTGEMTKYNIPAFPKGGDDDESNESEFGGQSGDTTHGGTGADFGGIDSGGYDPAGDTGFGGDDSGGYDPGIITGDDSPGADTGGDTGGDTDWSYNPFTNDWADLDVGRWWSEVAMPWFEETFGREPTAEEKKNLKIEHETGGDGSTVATENVLTYADWEGIEHDTQTGADAANAGLLSTAQTGAIGGAEGFEYGTEVAGVDEDGNAITTDESLTGGYSGAYEQMLSDAYDAAKTGVGSGLAGSGGMPTYDDAGNEIDPYGALEGAVEGQNTYLSGLADAYQLNAQTNYDDWLATNTTNINALTNLEDINDYTWTDMPEYDTDLSGGMVDGVWDPDWMPEFYSGFNQEYGKDFLADQNWTYDVDGNRVPGSYDSSTTGTTETTDDGDGEGVTAAPGSAAPGLTAAPGIKSKQAPSGVSQFGKNRSAARYI